MKSMHEVRSNFSIAFIVDKMERPSRLSLLIGIIGLGSQFLSTLLDGLHHFIDISVIPDFAAIFSIISGVFVLLLCGVIGQAFVLRKLLVKRRNAKKTALRHSRAI